MSNALLVSLRQLSDDELVARIKDLAARERDDVAHVVAHLAELDTRDVHFRAGYASLFAYCRDALALSEAEAYNRIEVARAARRFPAILEMLVQGSVNLTAVRLLSPHLTLENHRAVLESARGKRKTEVEEIVAGLAPRPDVAASVRKLPVPNASMSSVPNALMPSCREAGAGGSAGPGAPADSPPSSPNMSTSPPVALVTTAPAAATGRPPTPPPPATRALAPDRYRLVVTIGHQTLQKLRLAKDMLRHAIPSGDDAAILDRALTVLLDEVAKKKFAATSSPRPARETVPGSRHIPAEVKRGVWLRDLGRCAFVGTNGRRCTEHGFLEFHHLKPYAVGGLATVSNIQLRCRRHNDYEARVFFARDDSREDDRAADDTRGADRAAASRLAMSGDDSREDDRAADDTRGADRAAASRLAMSGTARLVLERVRAPTLDGS